MASPPAQRLKKARTTRRSDRTPLGEQEAMIFTDPERFFRPPYVGPRGWVGVRIDRRPNWSVIAKLVAQAHRLAAPPIKRRFS